LRNAAKLWSDHDYLLCTISQKRTDENDQAIGIYLTTKITVVVHRVRADMQLTN